MKTCEAVVDSFAPKLEAIVLQGWVRYWLINRHTFSDMTVLFLGLRLEFPSGIALHSLRIMREKRKCKRSLPYSLA